MNVRSFLKLAVVTVFICFSVVFIAAVPVSCRLTEEGIEIVSGEAESPKILSYLVENNSTLSIVYSQKIKISNVLIKTLDEEYSSEPLSIEYSEDNTKVTVNLIDPTEVGVSYGISGTVKDLHGNSLTFSLPFTGFNENPARLLLSEVRTKHSTSSGVIKKGEYVEVYVLKGGNTAGLEVITGSDGEAKKYCFPKMEVETGEFITVHYRMLTEGDCVDELEDNLALSTAESSCDSARDLWIDNVESRISDNDVIVIKDSCRDEIVDAVLFSSQAKTGWYYSEQKSLSVEAFDCGLWKGSSGISDAAVSDNITAVRTLCRKNLGELIELYSAGIDEDTIIEAGRDDWAVFVKGTPGCANEGEVYVK